MVQLIKNYHLKRYLVLVSALFFIACAQKPQKKHSGSAVAGTAVASTPVDTSDSKRDLRKAPDFTLKKMNGEMFTLSDHIGKVMVLNVWATWCSPCRKEIPDFIKIQKEMKDEGVLFVGVSIDRQGWSAVRPFVKKYNINYPIMVDNGSVRSKYGPFRGIPTTFIINKEGYVEYVAMGMVNKKILKPVLEKLANR